MFDNIGSRIKILAKIICYIGIAFSCLFGFAMMINSGSSAVGVGLVIMLLGSLLSWIGSFFTYGFGELIEKTAEIADNTSHLKNISAQSSQSREKKLAALEKWKEDGLITEEEYLQRRAQL